MSHLLLALVAAAFAPGGPSTSSIPVAPPYPPVSGPSGHMRPSVEALTYEYEAKAKALQAEMASLKKSDGGKLSAEHLSYVQEKLITLLHSYNAAMAQSRPMAVNADGTLSH